MFKKRIVFALLVNFVVFVNAATNYRQSLQQSIVKKDTKKIAKLFKKCSEIDKANALIFAASNRHKDMVLFILDSGVEVNAVGDNKTTALISASAVAENDEIIKALLEKGADVNTFDKEGENAFHKALKTKNNIETIELLLDKGCDVNSKFSDSEKTPLIYAVIYDDSKVSYLLEKGANVNASDKSGMTALNYAVKNNNKNVVEKLISANADVNAKTANGETALIEAVKLGFSDIAHLLITNNAKLDSFDSRKNTALFYAIKNNYVEISKELLAKGASISINGDKGDTLAELVGENEEMLALLKKHGYKPAPAELWNGFTDEMTKNQVIARANKLLKAEGYDCTWELNGRSGSIPRIFSANDQLNDFALPTALFKYKSPNSEFENIHGNIELYFYANKLYAIEIHWNTNIQDSVIKKAIDNYGANYEIKDDFDYYISTPEYNFDAKIYCWNKNGKKVYLNKKKGSRGSNSLVLTVFSKNLIQQYKTDLKEKEERQRQHAENERKRNSDRIRF